MSLSADAQYALAKVKLARQRRITPALTTEQDTLRQLRRDGIVVLPGYLHADIAAGIAAEVVGNTDLLTAGQGADIVHRNARRLLLNPRKHAPGATEVFDDPRISGLASAYLSPNAVADLEAIQVKIGINQESIIDLFHIDEWRPLLSVFVYLSDVGPDNAPMEYLVGSHRWRPWRIRREQDFHAYYRKNAQGQYSNEESPYSGCLLPTDVRRIRERYRWQPLSCVGPAGTLVIFDNLGPHRARPLISGSRLLLSSYWQLPDSTPGH